MDRTVEFKSDNCREVRTLLNDFLSHELDLEGKQRILFHLERCPKCRQRRSTLAQLREALARGGQPIAPVPDDPLVPFPPEAPSLSLRHSRTLRIASFILICAVAGSIYLGFVQDFSGRTGFPPLSGVVDHYHEIADDHLHCTGSPAELSVLSQKAIDEVQAALRRSDAKCHFVGVMRRRTAEADFTHYIFRGSSGLFSLFLEDRPSNRNRKRRGETITVEGVALQVVREDSLILGSAETPEYFIYITGDGLDRDATIELARLLLPELKRHLLHLR